MSRDRYLRGAGVFGFLGVALGAFGAHGLDSVLSAHGTTEIWETAVLYHLIHAVAMLTLSNSQSVRSGPWWAFALGTIIFSGSLYILAVTNLRGLGAITPIGGVSFLVGWLWWVIQPSPKQPVSQPRPSATEPSHHNNK